MSTIPTYLIIAPFPAFIGLQGYVAALAGP
ncbi:MAG: hypothetical protein L0Y67_02415 [Gammaproteobacteria bacterium]|nr:hypothetical protein [Gammaproteobacteria bacterium]MCI0590455.1 hypothetical protein [Gammaproteobacteria bacterium]